MKPARLFGGLSAVLLLSGCMLGGGSDTETITPSLSGEVVYASGSPTAGARVKLFEVDHDPSLAGAPAPKVAITDDSGRFTFRGLDASKQYNVIASEEKFGLMAFAGDVQARELSRRLTMFPPVTTEILLFGDDTFLESEPGVIVFIGTDMLAETDGVTPAIISTVPWGPSELTLEMRSSHGWSRQYILDFKGYNEFPAVIQIEAALMDWKTRPLFSSDEH